MSEFYVVFNLYLYLYVIFTWFFCKYHTFNTWYTLYTWCVHVEEGDLGATLSSVTIKISSCATNYLTTLPFLFGIITIMFALKDLFPVLVSSVFILAMFWTRPYLLFAILFNCQCWEYGQCQLIIKKNLQSIPFIILVNIQIHNHCEFSIWHLRHLTFFFLRRNYV